MTKTDDLSIELSRTYGEYLKGFLPFKYEDKTYSLVDIYVASPWTRCDVCGNHPIKYVYAIKHSDGSKLRVGNKCIERLTNCKVSGWFRKFKTKRENFIRNRRYLDGLDSILTAYKSSELPFKISENDIKRLHKAFERMCNGFNPTRKQKELAQNYISMGART